MTIPKEVLENFYAAKNNDAEATSYLVHYFISNAEKQLNNLQNLSRKEKLERISNCQTIVIQNIHMYYDPNQYVAETMEDIKNAIYLNQVREIGGSRSIIMSQRDLIGSKMATSDLSSLPVSTQELARKYYQQGMDTETLATIYKCTEALVCAKLRTVANKMIAMEAPNLEGKSFFTGNRN